MAPDLNSLPSSAADEPATPTARPVAASYPDSSPSPSPRSASVSLQAAATLNAGLQRGEPIRRSSSSSMSRHHPSPSAGRRRSQVLMNLQLADPSVPGPGEMIADPHAISGFRSFSPQFMSDSPVIMSTTADPHRARTSSLGELHQSLENEQEFQVNRLLQEIRRLQAQLAQRPPPQQQHSQPQSHPSSTTGPATDAVAETSTASRPRSSFDVARADLQQRRSRTPSRGASPRLRSTSFGTESGEPWVLGGRDESAFYQAETQMLIRENQMLRHRIRELERQFSDAAGTGIGASNMHEPSHSSQLARSTSVSEHDAARPSPVGSSMAPLPTVTDAPKQE